MALALASSLVACRRPLTGGAPSYTTGAVNFDGATGLQTVSLSATDNAVWSGSYWYNVNTGTGVIGVCDPANGVDSESQVYHNSAGSNEIQVLSQNTAQTAVQNDFFQGMSDNAWHHILFSCDLSTTPPTQVTAVDGVITIPNPSIGGGGPASFSFNGKPFWIGDDGVGDPFTGDLADVWFGIGQSLLAGGTIPAPTIAKFISAGKPVSLGADGSTPTGIAPAIFLRRAPAAAASTFANNLGTGGDFTITGALTDAPTSPSG